MNVLTCLQLYFQIQVSRHHMATIFGRIYFFRIERLACSSYQFLRTIIKWNEVEYNFTANDYGKWEIFQNEHLMVWGLTNQAPQNWKLV